MMNNLISSSPTLLLVTFALVLFIARRRMQKNARHKAQFYHIASRVFGWVGCLLFIVNIIAYLARFWYQNLLDFIVVTFIMIPLVFGGLTLFSNHTARNVQHHEKPSDNGKK